MCGCRVGLGAFPGIRGAVLTRLHGACSVLYMETLTVWKVEDHEGNGECRECGKTGLRWVTVLSDGSRVGGECAKRILGWAPTARKFGWVTGKTAIAERTEFGARFVLWTNSAATVGVISRNGVDVTSGPLEWVVDRYRAL